METLAMVEAFYIFNEALPGLLPIPIRLVENLFLLQGAEETLHRCIIPAGALAAHAVAYSMGA
jgi:hypothetical protein